METSDSDGNNEYSSVREKFLSLSLESTRKSYYPQLQSQLEAARKNERQLRLLTDSLPALISYVSASERYVFVNRAYEEVFGLDRSQIIGQHIQHILGLEDYVKVKTQIYQCLSGSRVHFDTCFTHRREGVSLWFEVNYVPDIDTHQGVAGFYALMIDITEQKKNQQEKIALEAKLRQAEKMESLGTLAGGIAHDFNNLLMCIQGRASLMAMDMEPGHPLLEHTRAIEEYVRSATQLTRQLLGFARGGKYEVKPMDMNRVMLNSAQMFGRTRKEIRIRIRSCQQPPIVEADQGQIEQVLLNIYVNAWQAMPDGGDLFLETKIVALGKSYCAPYQVESGLFVNMSVTDTGIGMDEATRRRIFDPFFTTKEKSRGTGLGLASAYGIIRNHGGMITVYSESGHGATFNIYLPLSSRKAGQEVSAVTTLIKGSETILLVDDEDIIIEVGKAMLEKLGYSVLVARSGLEAVEILTRMKTDIRLVILDLIMPEMDGGKTFDRLRGVCPDMPVLLSSGYAINGHADQIMRRGCNGFIQKPFTISELSQKIGGILNETKI